MMYTVKRIDEALFMEWSRQLTLQKESLRGFVL